MTNGYEIFAVYGQPDQEFTLDTSTDTVHWITGPLLDIIYSSGTLVFVIQVHTNAPPSQFYRATLVP